MQKTIHNKHRTMDDGRWTKETAWLSKSKLCLISLKRKFIHYYSKCFRLRELNIQNMSNCWTYFHSCSFSESKARNGSRNKRDLQMSIAVTSPQLETKNTSVGNELVELSRGIFIKSPSGEHQVSAPFLITITKDNTHLPFITVRCF